MSQSDTYTVLENTVHDLQSVLTVGFFDGVHRGHQSVLRRVVSEATRMNARPLMVTFDRPPKAVLLGTSVPLLTTLEEKARLAAVLGLSQMIVIPFDHSFAELEPAAFVDSILVDRIGLKKIVLGYDHRFGRGGAGNVETMRSLGKIHGFEVDVVNAQKLSGGTISSTRIREMLTDEGNVTKAAEHLGRYYAVTGEVVRGDGRGKTIGFPTANLRMSQRQKVVPSVGVYAVFARMEEKETWHPGVMNIGFRPTLTEGVELVPEVHLIDFDEDLYGRMVEVAFVRRLRSEKRFAGLQELVAQITQDRVDCIAVLGSVSLPD